MIRAGLVSVTFRQLSPEEIIELALENRLEGIEWGGSVHVPHGDLETAAAVAHATERAGLISAVYGSYYRANGEEPQAEPVVATAVALNAPVIRVWSGRKGSAEASEDEFGAVAANLKRFANLADREGIRVSIEFHPGTLADNAQSALRLLDEIGEPNVGVNWQQDPSVDLGERLASLHALLPYLTNLHVCHAVREGDQTKRRPLAEADEEWRQYLELAAGDRFALLEFMPGGTPDELPAEAATLHGWLDKRP